MLLPTWDGAKAATAGPLIRGIEVVGDSAKDCVWLSQQNGNRHAVLWPRGYWARFDPVRIYNEKGTQVWREGQPRDLGGGGQTMVSRLPPACRIGDWAIYVLPEDLTR
jgi:hypothetical protein